MKKVRVDRDVLQKEHLLPILIDELTNRAAGREPSTVITFRFFIATIVSTILVTTTMAAVPGVINFQGRLTDGAGDPLPDGAYTVQFAFYADSIGGVALWMESASVITHGGLFVHLLGSETAFPDRLFVDNNQLFVQVTAESETLTPRRLITAVPYASLAGDLAAVYANDSPFVVLERDYERVSVMGEDGQPRAIIRANDIGGQVLLLQPEEEIGIAFHAGLTGDASVILPDSSINAEETFNEPGLVVDLEVVPVTLVPMEMTDLAVVSIEIPEDGYIVLEGKCYVELSGTTGANVALVQIDENEGGSSQFPYYALAGMGGYVNTSSNYFPVYVTRVYYKQAGEYEFRLEGRANYASPAVAKSWDHVLTARYYATDYGPVSKVTSDPEGAPTAQPLKVTDPQNPHSPKMYYKVDMSKQAGRTLSDSTSVARD